MTLLRDDIDRALVFTRTKHGADRVVKRLASVGLEALAIHGNKSQNQRQRALEAFRSGKVKYLIATDVAARGIDIEGISHVINFEIPNVPEQYVHRIGRTARANREGEAIAFVSPDEKAYLRDIQKILKTTIPVTKLPEDFLKKSKELAARPALPKPDRPDSAGNPRPKRPKRRKRPKSAIDLLNEDGTVKSSENKPRHFPGGQRRGGKKPPHPRQSDRPGSGGRPPGGPKNKGRRGGGGGGRKPGGSPRG